VGFLKKPGGFFLGRFFYNNPEMYKYPQPKTLVVLAASLGSCVWNSHNFSLTTK